MMVAMNSRLNVYISPPPGKFPMHGGVREHLVQLYNCIGESTRVKLAPSEHTADVVHVESSYTSQRRPDLYVVHGGFLPIPIPTVLHNLKQARVIVSVAKWIADQFFPQYAHKTIVIPNGINLREWENLPPSGLEPGYVLYAKEWPYYIEDFVWLTAAIPELRFVTTVWPEALQVPSNVKVIGLQSRQQIRSVLNDAACLLLTGPEVCPTMLLEAWACKKPVLASVAGGAKELMVGDNGLYIYSLSWLLYNDKAEMEYMLRKLVIEQSATWDCATIGQAGYEQVVAKYQWKDLFKTYEMLYEAAAFNELETVIGAARTRSA